ncbi:hypothetical protein [Chryseobacterium chendengshani]|uniref:hypothetical protein n=1 Tax=Chryseobacterium sp. LJ756 TaxID=2864113 RepID=UPI001C64081F|nr:hypothetical protein [Chryseobacterium sp. LJ756]MBW7675876.1 hypothetical protein [Chryseobacterium sp. LJ756]
MKKVIFALILPLLVVSGLVFANREIKNECTKKPIQKQLSLAEKNAEIKKWEATPAGKHFKKWEASPAGKKVYAAENKIWKHITEYTSMEGVITSLSLPPESRLGFGVMVRINNEDYIVKFDAEKSQRENLNNLKVNDKIMIKSHYVSHAPKYAYPIISCEYAKVGGTIIFKRIHRKGGC